MVENIILNQSNRSSWLVGSSSVISDCNCAAFRGDYWGAVIQGRLLNIVRRQIRCYCQRLEPHLVMWLPVVTLYRYYEEVEGEEVICSLLLCRIFTSNTVFNESTNYYSQYTLAIIRVIGNLDFRHLYSIPPHTPISYAAFQGELHSKILVI